MFSLTIRLFGFDAYCLSSVKKNEVEKFEMGLKFVQEDRDCVQTEEKSQLMCPRVTDVSLGTRVRRRSGWV